MIPRLSSVEFLILSLMEKAGRPCYAVELVDASKRRVERAAGNGAASVLYYVYDLKRGSVYVTLDRMVTKGMIDKVKDYISSPRYTITDEGKKLLKLAQQFDKSK